MKSVRRSSNQIRQENVNILDKILDIVTNSVVLKVVKFGNSLYLHVPAEVAKFYGIQEKDLVKVAILRVERVIDKEVEVIK